MGWIITAAVLVLLALLPLGIRLRYNSEGLLVKAIAGPVQITLLPRPKKQKRDKKKKTKTEHAQDADLPKPPQPPKQPREKKPKEEKGGSLLDFLPLLKVAVDFLGDFRRKLRVNDLELKLILAGDDPCDLAVNYGRAWGALGNLSCALEQWFVIKKRNMEVECDFTASQTLVIAHLELTITLGRLLAAVCAAAVRALIAFLKIKKKRKGGAVK